MPTNSGGHEDAGRDVGLLHVVDEGHVRHLGGVADHGHLAVGEIRVVLDVGHGGDELEAVLALEALAHDVHVQEAEEAAAEAEAERDRALGLVGERRVVQLELLERVAELLELVALGREQAGEHHRLHDLVARQGFAGRALLVRDRVAHAHLRHVLDAGDDVADLPGLEPVGRLHLGPEVAELLDLRVLVGAHEADELALGEAAVDDAHVGDDAAVLVVLAVEDERARRRVDVSLRRRRPRHDRVEDGVHALAGLGGDGEDLVVRRAR